MNMHEYNTQLIKMINILTERKRQTEQEQGKKPNSNLISTKALLLTTRLITVVIETEVNEVTTSVNHLREMLLSPNSKHIARDMRDHFIDGGIGNFVNIKDHTVLKLTGEYSGISITSDSHYTFYINQPTLKALYEANIITKELYNKLVDDIPRSKELLQELSNKSNTTVYIRNYITNDDYIETKKEIHKDYNTMEGTYTETITSNINGKETIIDTKSNTFTPKSKDNNIIDIKRGNNSIILQSNIGDENIMTNKNENDTNLHKNDTFFDKNDTKMDKNDIKIEKNKENNKQNTINEEEKEERKRLLGLTGRKRIPNRCKY